MSSAEALPTLPRHTVSHLFFGKIKPFSKAGSMELLSAMDKSQADAVRITAEGVVGDEHGHPEPVHGGVNRAIHHIPQETYATLATALPAGQFDPTHLRPGGLGENFSSTGLLASDVCIGDTLRIGNVVLQVSQPRMPCWQINHRYKCKAGCLTVQNNRLSGWFYRVLTPGTVTPGQRLVLEARPNPGLTVHACYGVLMDPDIDEALVRRFANCAELDDEWRFISKARLENGNKLLKEPHGGRRLTGGEKAFRTGPSSAQVALNYVLWLVALLAVAAVAWEVYSAKA